MTQQDKILIVDDSPTNVVILEEMLGDAYQLATATCGEEALDILPVFNPALILLDIMMPGIDGYETCRRIRANPNVCHTKIIMLSAKTMLTERLQGYEAGADDYVTKPFEQDELLAKIQVYLRLKSVEEVDQLKSDVLTLLSHETRTPLNAILAPVQLMLAEEAMETAERTELLEMVQHGATRLQRLFEQVLILSQMKTGHWPFQMEATNLSDVVHSAVNAVAPRAAEHKVEIRQEASGEATVRLDLEQMLGVITTILENAIRFSPPQGCVEVGSRREDGHLSICVTDHGPGIEPDLLPRVFDEFASRNLQHHTQGLGLSLSIARQVVLAHNGTIEAESAEGVGTTFTVRLPVAVPADDSHETPALV